MTRSSEIAEDFDLEEYQCLRLSCSRQDVFVLP